MATKSEELAQEFERENAGFISFVRGLTPGQWDAACPEEGWTIGVVAHHIAENHQILANLVKTIANGGAVPPITADYINGLNADHADRAVGCTKEETVEVATSGGAEAAAILRSFSAQQLGRTAVMPMMGGEVSAAVISEALVIGHIGMHLNSIRQALAAQPA